MQRKYRYLATFLLSIIMLSTPLQGRANGIFSIIGTWKADVSIQSPAGFPNFFDLFSFASGGILAESHPLYSPYHPLGAILYAPGLGSWKMLPNGGYRAIFILPMQGAPGNPNYAGQFLGTNTIEYQLNLSADGTQLTGTWNATGRDTAGNIDLVASGAMTAERVDP